ncbi:hypothetical protein E4U41_002875, partial [Claviceps citrina]
GPPPAVASIPAAPVPVPASNAAHPIHTAPHHYTYNVHDYAPLAPPPPPPPPPPQQQQQQQQQQHPASQSVDYIPLSSHSASTAPNPSEYMTAVHPGHYVEHHHQPAWSTAPQTGPPAMPDAQGLLSDAFQQAVVAAAGAADPGPEFNIENLSETQLGELAPLWSWHSGNLDFANMPCPGAQPLPHAEEATGYGM